MRVTLQRAVHQLFEEQVGRCPSAIAVSSPSWELTYSDLNRRANQLAGWLRTLGVEAETCVALFLRPSPELIVGLIGILKAQGVGIPLKVDSPAEQLASAMAHLRPQVVLTTSRLRSRFPQGPAEIVSLDADWGRIEFESRSENLNLESSSANAACVIQSASGGGQATGVVLSHANITSMFTAMESSFGFEQTDAWALPNLQRDGFSFFELCGALLSGAKLVLVPCLEQSSADRFAQFIMRHRITVLCQMSRTFRQFLGGREVPPAPLRVVVLSGDVLDPEETGRWLNSEQGVRIVHLQGVVEAALCSEYRRTGNHDGALHRLTMVPHPDFRASIVDARMNLLPIGVPGQLWVGGVSLGRGYLNEPDATAERFVPDPSSVGEGERVYRTPISARYEEGRTVEFLGFADDRVQIRGNRVEFRQIEACLRRHPSVSDAAVAVSDDQEITAYLVMRLDTGDTTSKEVGELERTSRWHSVFEESYRSALPSTDPKFNTHGWNDSATGRAIPDAEMNEWVGNTVERLSRLNLNRVLEIGCGTGLLSCRLAPKSDIYVATDFSSEALQNLQRAIKSDPAISHVALFNRAADDFSGFQPHSFDTIIINSVIQYFPGVCYLLRVLEGAAALVKHGGALFIGDVRHKGLLRAFHASIETFKVPPTTTAFQLNKLIDRRVSEEDELVVTPDFFVALQERLPSIQDVTVEAKWGRHRNEMTCFRFDATLHMGTGARSTIPTLQLDWVTEEMTPQLLRQLLFDRHVPALRLTAVPNARLSRELKILSWLHNSDSSAIVGDFRESLASTAGESAVDPEIIRQECAALPYDLSLDWRSGGTNGAFDLVCQHQGSEYQLLCSKSPRDLSIFNISLEESANEPLKPKLPSHFAYGMKNFIADTLPSYLIPRSFVRVSNLPVSLSGRIDRTGLPVVAECSDPAEKLPGPTDALDYCLLRIWEDCFNRQIKVTDDFFDLGGTSLAAVALVARMQTVLRSKVSLADLFRNPRIEELAEFLRQHRSETAWSPLVPIQPLGSRSPFFCVHPGGGSAECYVGLAKCLDKDQPLWGLQASGLEPGQQPYKSVEEMAACYANEIRSAFPGPYLLGGWSFGGAVAYEMARILVAQGESVACLAIFDIGPQTFRWAKVEDDDVSFLMAALGELLPVEEAVLRALTCDERIDYILKVSREAGRDFLSQLGADGARRFLNVIRAHMHAQAAYPPEPYPGRITLFRATDQEAETGPDLALGWRELAQGGITIEHVPGDHSSMIRHPHVRDLAEKLSRHLLRVDASDSLEN